MSNRRVKSLGVDDDDLDFDDDYEEEYDEGEEELSAEDKEQLRAGTVKVRQALGPSYQINEKEIHDALWNYYYDIDKTVTLLKGKHKPKATPAAQQTKYQFHPPPVSAKGFFDDCPWLQIPQHRNIDILVEPLHSTRGLRGGASKEGKMSKLAALAAKRRQQEIQTPASRAPPPESSKNKDEYTAHLSKLSLTSESYKERRRKQEALKEKQAAAERARQEAARASAVQDDSIVDAPPVEEESVVSRTSASMFASTFLQNTKPTPQVLHPATDIRSPNYASYDFKDPSPDDIVYKAQTGRSTKPGPQAKAKTQEPPKTNITNGVNNLTISGAANVKSKNLDVIAEYEKTEHKNAANFVVIGHVDAGKSTLMGRLLFDLDAVDARTMEKYKKEAETIGKGSFAFAWVLDQGTEERERGVTIDIAQNKFSADKTDFTILDAPGHQDFVPNMIAGASAADFAVLVIDAAPGNFESGLKGQTREHVLLAKSIGVARLIVAVNKMDATSWSEERFNDITMQVQALLKSAGFNPAQTPIIPCSGLQGTNILHPLPAANSPAPWYTGSTLVSTLDSTAHALKTASLLPAPLRLPVTDIFRGSLQNPLSISGRIEAGTLQTGDTLLIQPSNVLATVRGLESDPDHDPRDWAVAGQNIIVHLALHDENDLSNIRTGDVACNAKHEPLVPLSKFTVKIVAFTHLTPMRVDIHGRGRLHVPGRIVELVATLDKKDGGVLKKKPRIILPEVVGRVVVEVEGSEKVPLEKGGRVVLRSGGESVGAGVVE